jgi:hypothetical protein
MILQANMQIKNNHDDCSNIKANIRHYPDTLTRYCTDATTNAEKLLLKKLPKEKTKESTVVFILIDTNLKQLTNQEPSPFTSNLILFLIQWNADCNA